MKNLLYLITECNCSSSEAVNFSACSLCQWESLAKMLEKGIILCTIQFFVKSKGAGYIVGHIIFSSRM